ncbi:hypothetical protein GOQ27_12305 [Clostridium sp. D2Q-11]|uniref:Uncharacterized protein n=1 Tax=Anaeromonas frigoriresistens TaxID=2683708 RepID=A0A942UU26_9FIRM|nr:hypothetical protein [Anaeromonas frigoriresistens]MBS4539249.1 hypothetical protein [Anaeromonas frigoriresistens]
MRKKFKLEIISDNLAEEMWGEIKKKKTITNGVIVYKCKYYSGVIFNDKEFNIDQNLKRKISPMILIETYNYRGKKYVIERTNNKEKIPEKLESKFVNKRYDERISVFALTEDFIKLFKYYHRDILKKIYRKKLDRKARKYKSENGFINNEIKESIKYLSLKAPEFLKNKDKNEAMKFLDKKLDEALDKLHIDGTKIDIDVELMKDRYKQRRELIK